MVGEVRIFRMQVWFNPPVDPTIVDIRMIFSGKVLISIKYDINIKGAALCTVISSARLLSFGKRFRIVRCKCTNISQKHDTLDRRREKKHCLVASSVTRIA